MSAGKKEVKMSVSAEAMTATESHDAKAKSGSAKTATGEDVSEARLQAQLQAHLGRKLKAVYQALVDEPVPEKILKLLRELELKEIKE
jgi:hypothetical protein